jgi:FMN-dependent NADH-azoreductase
MKLLHIDSSILGEASASRRLSSAIVATLRDSIEDLEIIRRDLNTDPIPHLDSTTLGTVRPDIAVHAPTPAETAKAAQVLEEFLSSDIVVIGAPMYNFSVPSQLKAWLDRIVVAGKSFRYSQAGVEGLAGGKQVFIASSRGGAYAAGTPMEAYDFQERYLRAILGFIGIDKIEFLRAEGLAFGPEQREAAVGGALAAVSQAVSAILPAMAA